MMTPIRIPYLEEALGVSIPTLEGFDNEKCTWVLNTKLPSRSANFFYVVLPDFMTADDVLEESSLPLYNAFVSCNLLDSCISDVRVTNHILYS